MEFIISFLIKHKITGIASDVPFNGVFFRIQTNLFIIRNPALRNTNQHPNMGQFNYIEMLYFCKKKVKDFDLT